MFKFVIPANVVFWNIVGSTVMAFIVRLFGSGFFVTIWKSKYVKVTEKLGGILEVSLKFWLAFHTWCSRFFYFTLIYHIYRSILFFHYFWMYWFTGFWMFYFSFLIVGTGYLIPTNYMSEAALLVVFCLACSAPYLGPLAGTVFVHLNTKGFTLDLDFRIFLILHSLVACNLVVLSVSHIWALHRYGSRTLEKANIVVVKDFKANVLIWEIKVWFIGMNVFYLSSRLDQVLVHNGSHFVLDIDYLKGFTHVPSWFLVNAYMLVAILSTADPRWITFILNLIAKITAVSLIPLTTPLHTVLFVLLVHSLLMLQFFIAPLLSKRNGAGRIGLISIILVILLKLFGF